MLSYDEMLKPELRQEAERLGLPVSGTKEDLVARLQAAQPAPEPPVAPGEENEPGGPAATEETEPPGATGPDTEPGTEPDTTQQDGTLVRLEPRAILARFPITGALTTNMHHQLCHRTLQAASQTGRRHRGSAHRTGWETIQGVRYAVYRVYTR